MERKKKIAFVTGVSEGIGASFTKILLQNGWEVIGISRNEQKLNSFKKSINSISNVFKSYKCDVQNIEKLKKIANENDTVTLLFLNAGIYIQLTQVNLILKSIKNI